MFPIYVMNAVAILSMGFIAFLFISGGRLAGIIIPPPIGDSARIYTSKSHPREMDDSPEDPIQSLAYDPERYPHCIEIEARK